MSSKVWTMSYEEYYEANILHYNNCAKEITMKALRASAVIYPTELPDGEKLLKEDFEKIQRCKSFQKN